MKYRALGDTGIEVSEIGFGAWGIGGDSYGPVDDAVSRLTLWRALELGINFLDTADLYGDGHSENLIGETFRGERERLVISSKVGFLEHYGDQDFSPGYIRESLTASLKRLGTDYLDIYHLHSPPLELLFENGEIMDALNALKREGLIRVVGISVRSPEDGVRAIRDLGFKSVQVNFNLVDQRAIECGLLELAREKRAGIIARTPLCFGFLTGRFEDQTEFGAGDHRGNWSKEQRQCWATAHRLFMEAIDELDGQTSAQIALRFCLSIPGITAAIPGMMKPGEVSENAAASDQGVLDSSAVKRFQEIYQDHVFFYGK